MLIQVVNCKAYIARMMMNKNSYYCLAARKEDLMAMHRAKKLLQFKLKVFPRGHTPTNYTRWFAAKEEYEVSKVVHVGHAYMV